MQLIKGDIFEGSWDCLLHVANTKCTFGAGIAKQIKKLYPAAYEADKKTEYMGEDKLALYSFANIHNQRIYNLYAQVGIGNDGAPLNRNLQYDYLFDSMFRAMHHLVNTVPNKKLVVAMPLLGGGLAGGVRQIILAIIESVFSYYPQLEAHVYEL